MHRNALFVLAWLVGCAAAPSRFPTGTWVHTTPEEEGVDSSALAATLDTMLDEDLHVHELLVVRHGSIVLDARFFPYDGTRPHDIASCTKTLTSLAVGAALEDGALADVRAPVLSFFPGRTIANDEPRKRAMTLEDLLTMRSGLTCASEAGEPTLVAMLASPEPVQFVLDLPMAASPGTEWVYCSPVSHLLSAVVGEVTGVPEDVWLRQRLFDPIGVGEVIWPRDSAGVTHGWGDARLHAEDLARIGLLLLHEGTWDGVRLLDPAWVAAATTDEVGASGPPGGYGYQIWTTRRRAFYASGRGGQHVFVVPAEDLVIVTLGSASPDELSRWLEILDATLLPGVHDAPLPASTPATSALEAAIARAATPPDPTPIDPAPPIAAEVSGSSYATAGGPVGWERFSLRFADDHATLSVTIAGEASSFEIGLDGVPRVSRGGRLGIDPRHHDLDLAATGRWTAEGSFEVTFDTLDRVDAGTLTFSFAGDTAHVDLFERTYVLAHLTFEGTR